MSPSRLFTNGACILYICTRVAKCRRVKESYAPTHTRQRQGLPTMVIISTACLDTVIAIRRLRRARRR